MRQYRGPTLPAVPSTTIIQLPLLRFVHGSLYIQAYCLANLQQLFCNAIGAEVCQGANRALHFKSLCIYPGMCRPGPGPDPERKSLWSHPGMRMRRLFDPTT